LKTLIWTVLGFASGALPFSIWIGQLALNADIRRYWDGNPGATNVLRAGGKGWALLAAVLDMLKGALPVALAYVRGLYFVGGTTHPGGGVPMVTLSGKVAAAMVSDDLESQR
jgi:glycerol-3-phosphate acyltransferase PlsY